MFVEGMSYRQWSRRAYVGAELVRRDRPWASRGGIPALRVIQDRR